MKKLITLCLLFIAIAINAQDKPHTRLGSHLVKSINTTQNILAAPVNDGCAGAILIPTADLNGTCLSGYTTTSATTDGTTPSCFDRNRNVWFKFVAQGPDIEVTVNTDNSAFNGIGNPQIAVFSIIACPNIGYTVACSSYDCGFCAYSETWAMNNCGGATSLTVGNTYYITVAAGQHGNPGDFIICVNNPAPNPAGTDCSTATLLCSNSTVSGNASLWGSQELTTAGNSGCLNTCGEVNSSWYVLNVATSGTLTFVISPTVGTDDYDFAVYSGATCTLGAPVNCNYSATPGNTGLELVGGGGTSQGQAGTTWNNYMNVLAGDVYLVLVNGFTPSANNYTMSFGGTATLGCSMPPILPIGLLDFTSTCGQSNYVELRWITATETNNDFFTVERSKNGVKWDVVGNVKGAGNSTGNLNYSLRDDSPFIGINYYKLKQTDFNGEYTYSTPIACETKDSGVKVYPNPATNQVNIISNIDNTVKIYNSLGQSIYSSLILSGEVMTIDLSSYSAGIYYIEVGNIHEKLLKK